MSFKKKLPKKLPNKTKNKPAWDSTISDMNSYKLTDDELLQKKLDHVSKNLAKVNFSDQVNEKDTIYRRLSRVKYGEKPKLNDIKDQKHFLNESLLSDKKLYELFQQSERALQSVEGTYGNPAKKYVVNPTVTLAPKATDMALNTNNSNSGCLNDVVSSESDEEENIEVSKNPEQLSTDFEKNFKNVKMSLKDTDDELTRFRRFIENERRQENVIQTQVEDLTKQLAPTVELTTKKCDEITETDEVITSNSDMKNDKMVQILEQIKKSLVFGELKNTGTDNSAALTNGNVLLNDQEKNLCNDIGNAIKSRVDHIEIENKQLRNELKHNQELIDALTLELIKNTDKIKSMKQECDNIVKYVSKEMSEMKSVIINNLKFSVNNNNQVPRLPSSIESHIQLTHKDIQEELERLQKNREETNTRLNNLIKLSQVSAPMSEN